MTQILFNFTGPNNELERLYKTFEDQYPLDKEAPAKVTDDETEKEEDVAAPNWEWAEPGQTALEKKDEYQDEEEKEEAKEYENEEKFEDEYDEDENDEDENDEDENDEDENDEEGLP